ncbi:MAG: hypothetical protein HYS68_00090 [Candidatus Levybacteria bacterium]|nr:hypothetical protein [Candidatus Levybacteria bacterium]
MVKKYLQLNDVNCYKRAFALSNYVWDIVVKWDYFTKNTVGMQFATAIDYKVYQYQIEGITMKQCSNLAMS